LLSMFVVFFLFQPLCIFHVIKYFTNVILAAK
jgi:hypothetical protein